MQRVRTTSRVVVRTIRRDIALGLTAGKREELVTLARRFARGRKTYVDAYWHPRFFATVSDPRLRVVQSQRRAGWLVPDLSVHQNKVCLESSLALVRSSWSGTVKAAMRVVSRDKGWDSSRLWALATLRSVDQIQECLVTPLRLATRQQRRMRRLLLRVRGGKPRESGEPVVRARLQPVQAISSIDRPFPRRLAGSDRYTARSSRQRASCRIVARRVCFADRTR